MVWNAGSCVEVSRNSATVGQEAGWAGYGEVGVVPRVNGGWVRVIRRFLYCLSHGVLRGSCVEARLS